MHKITHAYKKGYRVTEDGRVISPKGKELSLGLDTSGYPRFYFRCKEIKSNPISLRVHRLQAFQKFGMKIFKEGVEVRHEDGDKNNISWDNILIGTHQENMMDIPEQIRINRSLHATSFCRKNDKQDVKDFYKDNGKSYKKTMEEFNISSKGTLHYILNN